MKTMLIDVLLLTSLLTAWARSSVLLYGTVGGEILMPCRDLHTADCSTVNWTFFIGGQVRYLEVVRDGRVTQASDKAARISLTSNCSVILRDLEAGDAGSYVCKQAGYPVSDAYLSVLSISSASSVSDLRPGGRVRVTCILHTFYDAGNCKSYSAAVFTLRWLREDGKEVESGERFRLNQTTACNIILEIFPLQMEDDHRRLTCLVNTSESKATFLDFQTSFLIQNSSFRQKPTSPAGINLPISRILLCVALPLMVATVGVYTWKTDQKRAKVSVTELREIH